MYPVTVIIPTFNRAEFLGIALESVLRQTYQDFELIIVDDGSTDSTKELVEGFYHDPRVRYLYQRNQGPSAARNAGIKASSSDLLAFLDSDDRFEPTKLEQQIAAMAGEPHYLISHTQETWYRRGQLLNQKNRHRKESGDIFARCLELCAVGMSTVMVRRSLFDAIGMFDEELPCCEDYDLWLRASVAHQFLLVDLPLTTKDGGRPDQLSWQYRVGMDCYRIQAIRRVMDSGKLSSLQKELAMTELVKKCTIYGNGCMKHNRPEEGRKYLALAGVVDSEHHP